MHSSERPPIAFESASAYRWFGDEFEREAYAGAGLPPADQGAAKTATERPAQERVLAQLRSVLDTARQTSAQIRSAAEAYKPHVDYPPSPLSEKLRSIAALIHSDFGARIFSTEMGGFDTHADQRGRHDQLMRGLGEGLGAFVRDLSHSQAGRDTVVLVYSEFGRRLRENASGGTDHGKAGPLLLCGAQVKGGLHGRRPSLTDLDDGDPAFTTDFRSVFGELVEHWMHADAEAVLGGRYPRVGLFG